MMRLRAGSGGGYACRVQRRKALAAAEAGALVSGIENREQSCKRFLKVPDLQSTFAHGGEYPGSGRRARQSSLAQLKKELKKRVSVHANNALASVLASIHG